MKWKITGQFLIAIIVTLFISLISFMVLNVFILYKGPEKAEKIMDLHVKAPNFTLDFEKNIKFVN
jgi:hypothetical protein